jgi:Ca2+-binding EF-hand superfamily protein
MFGWQDGHMNRMFILLALPLLASTAVQAQAPGNSRAVPAIDEAFKRVDANKDGKLDPQEFGRFSERSRSMAGANANEVFGKLDTNKDGMLTLEEFRGVTGVNRGGSSPAPAKPAPPAPPAPPMPQPPGNSRAVPAIDEAFKRVDANEDGKLDPQEFGRFSERSRSMAGTNANEVFGKLDTNKDGVLTLEEFRGVTGVNRGSPAPSPAPALPPSPVPPPTKPESPTSKFDKISNSEGLAFFETKIRPVLVNKCYECHSADAEKVKGGLALDTREGIRIGGDSGPAVVPGNLAASLLIKAIRFESKDFAMPPQKSGGKLPDAVIKDFEQWVQMGAPDPRDGTAKVTNKQETWKTAQDWWAWQPPKKSPAPAVMDTAWPRNDIDRYLLSALEEKGLKPVGDADKLTLLRRVTFDLTGLPPTPQEVSAFYNDTSPDAFRKVVDRLLDSKQFGERWGRHWLDVARYAESTGKDINLAYPHAWRYRDYVISAFNNDKPYDQFLREQLAGDLLPAKNDRQRAEQLVATGFLAMGTKSVNEANPRQFALDLADEQIDTVTQALLGVTAACARCHDHKFDPISQREYYALAGIFLSTDTRYGTFFAAQNRSAAELIELPKGAGVPLLPLVQTPQEREKKQFELKEFLQQANDIAAATFDQSPRGGRAGRQPPNQQMLLLLRMNQVGLLETELKSYDESGKMRPLAMGVMDQPTRREESRKRMRETPRYGSSTPEQAIASRFLEREGRFARPPEFKVINDSPIFARGDVGQPGEKVPRGFLSLLTQGTPPAIPASSSGRRELAEWMLADSNPLTARVMANRVWQWLFGQGLVTTPDNFGTTGSPPSNLALLDTLAVRFSEGGWSVKNLIRGIVNSHAYQLASTYDETNYAADPENALVWRMNKRRLDAESIRDAILAVSGQLDLRPPLGSPIAMRGNGPIGEFKQFPNVGVPEDTLVEAGTRTQSRSVYLPIARDMLPDALAVFDFAEPGFVSGSRDVTNVPEQALYMLNSPTLATAAQKLAERVIAASPSSASSDEAALLAQRVQYAYGLMFSRVPSEVERQAAFDFFAKFPTAPPSEDFRKVSTSPDPIAPSAWVSFCRALFASAEFRYLN